MLRSLTADRRIIGGGSGSAGKAGDDLALLLATEQRLERAIAEVQGEADGLRAAAAVEAAADDVAGEAALEVARKRTSVELEVDAATRIAAIEANAQADVERGNSLCGERLEREARRLASRLVVLAEEAP